MPALLAVMCGLRRGEITALRWGSVDFGRKELSIVESTEQTVKGVRSKETKSGRARTVALPAMVVDELRRARVAQAEELLKVGVRLTDQTHVVAQADGKPLQPNSLTHEFVRLSGKASGVPRIRFHDLRHTHATQLLLNGVHPKVAQERLGHSSVGITLDLYSHVLPGMQEDAAAKVDAAIRAAIDRSRGRLGNWVANARFWRAARNKKLQLYQCVGRMAEWFKAAVLKTTSDSPLTN
jgi:integrase